MRCLVNNFHTFSIARQYDFNVVVVVVIGGGVIPVCTFNVTIDVVVVSITVVIDLLFIERVMHCSLYFTFCHSACRFVYIILHLTSFYH